MLYEVITDRPGPPLGKRCGNRPGRGGFRRPGPLCGADESGGPEAGTGKDPVCGFLRIQRKQHDRITSYNVCYTKLLRSRESIIVKR